MEQVITHAWTERGLGAAPFKLVGVWSYPSKSLAEQNPTAYNNAMAGMPRGYGIGFCAVCGMGLTNNYLIRSADGNKFAVGCDCVAKTDDTKLIEKTELLKRRANREKARARKEAKRQAAHAAAMAELDAQRARNGGFTDAEVQRNKEKELEAQNQARIYEALEPIFNVLEGKTSDFWQSITNDLKRGRAPYGRGMIILLNELEKHGFDSNETEEMIKAAIQ